MVNQVSLPGATREVLLLVRSLIKLEFVVATAVEKVRLALAPD